MNNENTQKQLRFIVFSWKNKLLQQALTQRSIQRDTNIPKNAQILRNWTQDSNSKSLENLNCESFLSFITRLVYFVYVTNYNHKLYQLEYRRTGKYGKLNRRWRKCTSKTWKKVIWKCWDDVVTLQWTRRYFVGSYGWCLSHVVGFYSSTDITNCLWDLLLVVVTDVLRCLISAI